MRKKDSGNVNPDNHDFWDYQLLTQRRRIFCSFSSAHLLYDIPACAEMNDHSRSYSISTYFQLFQGLLHWWRTCDSWGCHWVCVSLSLWLSLPHIHTHTHILCRGCLRASKLIISTNQPFLLQVSICTMCIYTRVKQLLRKKIVQ